jgi:hypothetical protein
VFVAVQMPSQQALSAELMDGGRRDSELAGDFFAGEHPAKAQSFEAAAKLVGTAHHGNLLRGEGITAPIAVSQRVEALGVLQVGRCLRQFGDEIDDGIWRFADQRDWSWLNLKFRPR